MKPKLRKRYTLITLALLVSFGYGLSVGVFQLFPFKYLQVAKQYFIPPASEQLSKYGLARVQQFAAVERRANIVMIGDSLTEQALWTELLQDTTVANRGINGSTTKSVLARLETITNARAETAFVMLGINDILAGRSVSDILKNYRKILEAVRTNGSEIVLQSTLRCSNLFERCREILPKVNELNSALELLSLKKGYSYIDLNSHLGAGFFLSNSYTYDGIHLNGKAYRIWVDEILTYLNTHDVG